ncbi:Protein of unknown function [Gryllus bimaculatus]|nr:Protein of unknown function [Gryllus bimaculatus]
MKIENVVVGNMYLYSCFKTLHMKQKCFKCMRSMTKVVSEEKSNAGQFIVFLLQIKQQYTKIKPQIQKITKKKEYAWYIVLYFVQCNQYFGKH